MTENSYFIFTIFLIILFLGILFWTFRKKRKKRFNNDSNIPFHEKR